MPSKRPGERTSSISNLIEGPELMSPSSKNSDKVADLQFMGNSLVILYHSAIVERSKPNKGTNPSILGGAKSTPTTSQCGNSLAMSMALWKDRNSWNFHFDKLTMHTSCHCLYQRLVSRVWIQVVERGLFVPNQEQQQGSPDSMYKYGVEDLTGDVLRYPGFFK